MTLSATANRLRTVITPGRVNLIGDHTDYSKGLALPVAINLYIVAKYEDIPGARVLNITTEIDTKKGKEILRSEIDFNDTKLDDPLARFIKAAADIVNATPAGILKITSTLPMGAGLSSSASFIISLLLSFSDLPLDENLAKMAQQTEHIATSAKTGMLDQLAIINGKKGSAMLINFEDNSLKEIYIPPEIQIAIVHSGITRKLSDSNYSKRADAVALIENRYGKLNKMTISELTEIHEPELKPLAKHIITENKRVLDFSNALIDSDFHAIKEIIHNSQLSLSQDYGVSLPEIDNLVENVNSIRGVIGSRLTGGGFGGCLVVLAEKEKFDYQALSNLNHQFWLVRPSDGPRVETV